MAERYVSFENQAMNGLWASQITLMKAEGRNNDLYIREDDKNGTPVVIMVDNHTALEMANWILDNVEEENAE